MTDANNCGACGTVCTLPETCRDGVCSCGGAGWTACGTGATGACANLQTDKNNCGSCGNACVGTQSCVGGTCSCGTNYVLCGTQCVLLSSDRNNCGSCGNACAGTLPDGGVSSTAQACISGQCQCQAGLTLCGADCVNLLSSPTNCGSCGNKCAVVCQNGTCI
jgi:hypothetical protein